MKKPARVIAAILFLASTAGLVALSPLLESAEDLIITPQPGIRSPRKDVPGRLPENRPMNAILVNHQAEPQGERIP